MKFFSMLILLIIPVLCIAQPTQHSELKFNCSLCHSCESPTKTNPCLKACPRAEIITVHHSAEEAPGYIILDKFKNVEDNYAPVNFSHKAHAEMSVMAGGCEMCHHYNPPGRVVACSECHSQSRIRDDLRTPDLKGALHRQCIDCHRLWSSDVACADCHHENITNINKADPVDRYHPQIEEPERLVYDTDEMEGYVTFYHSDHTNIFGQECNDCHKQESCVSCHIEEQMLGNINLSQEEKHDACSGCHDTDGDCESCHKEQITPGFYHAVSTGFNLSKYHSKVECGGCHTTPKVFKGLSGSCAACHKNWSLENFEHSITGLSLDENHSENDCEDCHVENDYKNPTCDNCHDEEIFYPDFLPGIMK